ncbi:hypothetical protein ROLI_048230 (plasmid) [Roseobacter fucihabitans]|uniref:Uncharacterized protein n=1 Tax=Roseobacter fucihabitans TaxID=1537242 RepID=A0ABZ2BZU2_9RHOB|nr:hypothetical protein [Roseobacter litoralis]MBC6968331.1 hypothetical protein [Roseobacter litoralis]
MTLAENQTTVSNSATVDRSMARGAHGAKVADSEHPAQSNESRSRGWLSVVSQPYLIGNTILAVATPIGVLAVVIGNGMTGLSQGLVSGDPLSLILLLSVCTAFLSATMGLTLLALAKRETVRDQKEEERISEFRSLSKAFRNDMREVLQSQDETSDKINHVIVNAGKVFYRRPNNSSAWSGFAANSSFISVGGRCSSEVRTTRTAQGDLAFEVSLENVSSWVSRVSGSTRLSEIMHIVPEGDGSVGSLQKLLACYRALQGVLGERSIKADLSNVKIVVVEDNRMPSDSIFLGVRTTSSLKTEDAAFVMKYCSIPLSTAGIMNSEVDVSYSTELVGQYLGVVNELVEGASRIMNLVEAEALYGANVPSTSNASNVPISISTNHPYKREPFDSGDGSFCLGEYLC